MGLPFDLLLHSLLGRFIKPYLDDLIYDYGLDQYWWFWPAVMATSIAGLLVLRKVQPKGVGFYEWLDKRFPEPTHRDSWL